VGGAFAKESDISNALRTDDIRSVERLSGSFTTHCEIRDFAR